MKNKKKNKKKNKSAGSLYKNQPLSPPSSSSGGSAPGRADTSSTPSPPPHDLIAALIRSRAHHDPDLSEPLTRYTAPKLPDAPFGRRRFLPNDPYHPATQHWPKSMSDPTNPFGWTNPISPNNPSGLTNMNSFNNPVGWFNPVSPNYLFKKR